ncbi:MAG: alkaline phosphatase family protein, partial [Acidimicrobiia bacterium]|nr:alkaline phosphatase family protein [Acidimicrobiia bacterium]
VAFQRVLVGPDEELGFVVTETEGENPVANTDEHAIRTLAEEIAAAAAAGHDAADPQQRFIPPESQSYPWAYERVAQLFDSPHAPDLAVSTLDWATGPEPGTHGALHVRQARAPLWFAGAGVIAGTYDLAARAVDIAPTMLAAAGFPLIDGADATGRTSSERGRAPDVYLRRQDGRVLHEVLDPASAVERVYVFLLDGLHPTELYHRLDTEPESLPNLRRLHQRAAVVRSGSIVNFPSITWPSHTAIGTGTWCGHHDVVNPSYWLRDEQRMVSPQGQELDTEGYASPDVESLSEAFHRVYGDDCITAAIHAPFGRSAKHAPFEGRMLCEMDELRRLGSGLRSIERTRWTDDANDHTSLFTRLDTRGTAQAIELFTSRDRPPPRFVYHELLLTDAAGHDYGPHSDGLRDALDECDERIGRVLDAMEETGTFDDTLFVVTTDHGMAPQDVSLEANAVGHVGDNGLEVIVADPMVWLKDVAVVSERAADRRTGRVTVCTLEPDMLPIEGATVVVTVDGDEVVREPTTEHGRAGFPTPPDVGPEDIRIEVLVDGHNPRRLRLDGSPIGPDLVRELYS